MHDNRRTVLILEDNDVRVELMGEALESCVASLTIQRFDSAREIQAKAQLWLPHVCLISLDFDLSGSTTRNPGTGMDAVNALTKLPPVCPVIIHTSLSEVGKIMAQDLRAHGWTVRQVRLNTREAIGDWIQTVESLLSADQGR